MLRTLAMKAFYVYHMRHHTIACVSHQAANLQQLRQELQLQHQRKQQLRMCALVVHASTAERVCLRMTMMCFIRVIALLDARAATAALVRTAALT